MRPSTPLRTGVLLLVPAAAAVAALAAAVPADAGPRKGKVVRVERPRTGARGTPRICRLSDPGKGMCWGRAPIKGELGFVVGPEGRGQPGNRGQIQVGEVTEAQDGCSMPKYWMFDLEPMSSNLVDLEPWSTWVVLDVDVTSNAKVLEPSAVKSPDDANPAWLAIDRGRGGDGESAADFLVTAFGCDSTGSPVGAGGGNGYCIEYWVRGTGQWSKIRRDIVVPDASCVP